MDWKELGKDIIQGGAPLLGGLLGGPGGAAAGALIASLFGADPDDPKDIAFKMSADPDAYIKLKEFELNNKAQITEMYLKDVQSARDREVEITKVTGKRDINLYVLAWVVVAGFFILTGMLMFIDIPEGTSGVANLLFGALVAGFATVLNYFFGSSKGSADKNALLHR